MIRGDTTLTLLHRAVQEVSKYGDLANWMISGLAKKVASEVRGSRRVSSSKASGGHHAALQQGQ